MNIKIGILNVPKHCNKHDLIHFVTLWVWYSLGIFSLFSLKKWTYLEARNSSKMQIQQTRFHWVCSRAAVVNAILLMSPSIWNIWAASWQNQQNDCAPSEDSDQSGHPPSLIRVFAVREDSDQSGIRPVWSEVSLSAQWIAKDTSFISCGQRRLWSDWVDNSDKYMYMTSKSRNNFIFHLHQCHESI